MVYIPQIKTINYSILNPAWCLQTYTPVPHLISGFNVKNNKSKKVCVCVGGGRWVVGKRRAVGLENW